MLHRFFLKEGGTRADCAALKFKVDSIGSMLTALKSAGVVFEEFDLQPLETVNNVCRPSAEKAAWFGDTAGN